MKNGGSAFHEIETDLAYDREESKYYERTYSCGGMTLRDYFAATALSEAMRTSHNLAPTIEVDHRANAARIAYEVADAMLAARVGEATEESEK